MKKIGFAVLSIPFVAWFGMVAWTVGWQTTVIVVAFSVILMSCIIVGINLINK